MYTLLFSFADTHMRPLGIPFHLSDSLFRTQQSLVNVAGHVLLLPHFTPTRLGHLQFVHHLLQTSCDLDICCTITGTDPAYIPGVPTSYYRTSPAIGVLHIARTPSTILDNIYRKSDIFVIGTFQFRLAEREGYDGFPDFSTYDITFENVTVSFSITIIDVSTSYGVSTTYGSKSSINVTKFVWEYLCGFAFKMYALICVPLETPRVLHFYHHRAATDGWKSDCLCDVFSEEYRHLLQPFVGNSTSDRSCRCNVSPRQAPSLSNLASHTVFHLTFNLSQFTLSGITLYHQYLYAVESTTVSEEELVPLTVFTFSTLKCTFVRDKRCGSSKRFHNDCVIPSDRYWPATYTMFCESPEEAIATLCDDKDDWWCDFCTRPLFKTRSCLFF